eukprot:TRINITY_DN2417_c0_g1_i3.p1 TRINITY_DN2417_c0_g1~~TRINITY_DN2417_c0_g1_i3.p1  ORF type:complete len:396 (-),score=78.17 TRINITY_DN2417_c0_g1_i3:21-1208(-)
MAPKEAFDKMLQLQKIYHMMDTCAEQQKTIVDDVLSLSKLQNDKTELNLEPFEIGTIVDKFLQLFQQQLEKKGLLCVVNIDIPKDKRWFKGDSSCISQILINLLSNAIKFTEQGEISLSISSEDIPTRQTKLSFRVSDTGIGMLPEEVEGLFGRFSQANSRISSEFGGSGLGLAISQKLVELMGGSFRVFSKKGSGTRFEFSIVCSQLTDSEKLELNGQRLKQPRRTNNDSISKDIDALQKQLTGRRILIVEDNRINQTILLHYLEQCGCLCELAINGLQAWEKYYAGEFDSILMDLEMPLMNGFQATQKIRAHERELFSQLSIKSYTPIIALSGYTRKELIEEAICSGVDDFVTKPFKKELLYSILVKYARQRTNSLPTGRLSSFLEERAQVVK